MTKLRKGDSPHLKVESLAFGGLGVAKYGDKVVFVRGAIPQQTVKTAIIKKRKSYFEGIALDVIEESEYYFKPPCLHFKYCGGCSHQNLYYTEQLNQKQKQVEDIFLRLGGYESQKVNKIVGCVDVWNYRNKMEFTFSKNIWYENSNSPNMPLALGLHIPKRFDKILDISDCHIQDIECNSILKLVKELSIDHDLSVWDVRKHVGFLRNVVIRKGFNTDEIMVNFITSEYDREKLIPIAKELSTRFSKIISIVNNINSRHGGSSQGQSEYNLYGKSVIHEKLGDYKFIISANSFFQTNTKQAEKLYQIILNECKLTKKDVVYDLFCGTGSISIFLANRAKHVFGFELVKSAIKDAKNNLKLNDIDNCTFFEGDLMNIFTNNNELENIPKPDVMVIDPPRSGMHPKTVNQVLEQTPKRIVYVSCNPSTQVRDIKFFTENSYSIINIQPVDMFPHTPHIENIVTMEIKK